VTRRLFNLFAAVSLLIFMIILFNGMFAQSKQVAVSAPPPDSMQVSHIGPVTVFNYHVSAVSTVRDPYNIVRTKPAFAIALILSAIVPICWLVKRWREIARRKSS